MRFVETELPGAYIIELELHYDERGFFARTWCEREFAANGIPMTIRQCNASVNRRRGTLRGLHYQMSPHEEAKTVTCVRGAIYDVIVDLRREASTFKRHVAVELSAENRRMVFVPPGFAHGFQTLADDTEVHYLISAFHVPDSAHGVRWNDPAFGIVWPPTEERIISARDRTYPDFI